MYFDIKEAYADSYIKKYLSDLFLNYINTNTQRLKSSTYSSYYLIDSLKKKSFKKKFLTLINEKLINDINIFSFSDNDSLLISNKKYHFILNGNNISLFDSEFNIIYKSFQCDHFNRRSDLFLSINSYIGFCNVQYLSNNEINFYMSGKSKIKKIIKEDKNIKVFFENSFYNAIRYDENFNMLNVEVNSATKRKLNLPNNQFKTENIETFFKEMKHYLDIYFLSNDKEIKTLSYQNLYFEQFSLIKKILNNPHYEPHSNFVFNSISDYINEFYKIENYQTELEFFRKKFNDTNLIEILEKHYALNSKIILKNFKDLLFLSKIKENPDFLFNEELINNFKYLNKYNKDNIDFLSTLDTDIKNNDSIKLNL